jgi:hypothetical protein
MASETDVPTGFFRIVKPSTLHATADSEPPAADSATDKIERLAGKALKLVPGEIIGLHASVTSLWVGDQTWPAAGTGGLAAVILEWILPIFGLVASVAIRARGSQRPGAGWGDVQWAVPFFAGSAYIGWLLSTGHPVLWFTPDPRLGGTILILLGVLPTLLYGGVEQ